MQNYIKIIGYCFVNTDFFVSLDLTLEHQLSQIVEFLKLTTVKAGINAYSYFPAWGYIYVMLIFKLTNLSLYMFINMLILSI